MEYRSDLVYIPQANECFRKCIELIYQTDYSQIYREYVKQSVRCKNIGTHKLNFNHFVANTIWI